MSEIYFTLTGTQYYHGKEFLEAGMHVMLEKDPENKYDKEAIAVKLSGLGKIGYVANSSHTVVGESFSAGRLYDKIADKASGKVLYVMPTGVLCKLSKKSLITEKLES